MKRPALVALFLAITSAACNSPSARSPAPGTQSLRQPIIGGAPDTSPAHQAVVAIQIQMSGGTGGCSGTVIAHKVVLTAGHCTWDEQAHQGLDDASRYRVTFGRDADHPDFSTNVTAVNRHPSYQGGVAHDIAILRLVDEPAGLVPIPALPLQLGLGAADVNVPVEFVGFGLTDLSNPASWGTRMHVAGKLDLVCGSDGCGGQAEAWNVCYEQSAGGPASGDSGGPALLTRGGIDYVAAVTSYGDSAGTVGCSYRTDGDNAAFIAPYLLPPRPGGEACGEAAECESQFCADGVCCNAACTGSCETCSAAAGASQNGRCETVEALPCDDHDSCTVADACHQGTCHGTPAEGVACDDHDLCTADDACHQGACRGEARCGRTGCLRAGSCNPFTGTCSGGGPLADGTACDDANACSGDGACQGGSCIPGPTVVACPAPDECHESSACVPASGACEEFAARPDGSTCKGGSCQAGACVLAPSLFGCSSTGSGPGQALMIAVMVLALAIRANRPGSTATSRPHG